MSNANPIDAMTQMSHCMGVKRSRTSTADALAMLLLRSVPAPIPWKRNCGRICVASHLKLHS